eukprot:Nk52_evm19s295 gene=Nk52_evmTU19s295
MGQEGVSGEVEHETLGGVKAEEEGEEEDVLCEVNESAGEEDQIVPDTTHPCSGSGDNSKRSGDVEEQSGQETPVASVEEDAKANEDSAVDNDQVLPAVEGKRKKSSLISSSCEVGTDSKVPVDAGNEDLRSRSTNIPPTRPVRPRKPSSIKKKAEEMTRTLSSELLSGEGSSGLIYLDDAKLLKRKEKVLTNPTKGRAKRPGRNTRRPPSRRPATEVAAESAVSEPAASEHVSKGKEKEVAGTEEKRGDPEFEKSEENSAEDLDLISSSLSNMNMENSDECVDKEEKGVEDGVSSSLSNMKMEDSDECVDKEEEGVEDGQEVSGKGGEDLLPSSRKVSSVVAEIKEDAMSSNETTEASGPLQEPCSEQKNNEERRQSLAEEGPKQVEELGESKVAESDEDFLKNDAIEEDKDMVKEEVTTAAPMRIFGGAAESSSDEDESTPHGLSSASFGELRAPPPSSMNLRADRNEDGEEEEEAKPFNPLQAELSKKLTLRKTKKPSSESLIESVERSSSSDLQQVDFRQTLKRRPKPAPKPIEEKNENTGPQQIDFRATLRKKKPVPTPEPKSSEASSAKTEPTSSSATRPPVKKKPPPPKPKPKPAPRPTPKPVEDSDTKPPVKATDIEEVADSTPVPAVDNEHPPQNDISERRRSSDGSKERRRKSSSRNSSRVNSSDSLVKEKNQEDGKSKEDLAKRRQSREKRIFDEGSHSGSLRSSSRKSSDTKVEADNEPEAVFAHEEKLSSESSRKNSSSSRASRRESDVTRASEAEVEPSPRRSSSRKSSLKARDSSSDKALANSERDCLESNEGGSVNESENQQVKRASSNLCSEDVDHRRIESAPVDVDDDDNVAREGEGQERERVAPPARRTPSRSSGADSKLRRKVSEIENTPEKHRRRRTVSSEDHVHSTERKSEGSASRKSSSGSSARERRRSSLLARKSDDGNAERRRSSSLKDEHETDGPNSES